MVEMGQFWCFNRPNYSLSLPSLVLKIRVSVVRTIVDRRICELRLIPPETLPDLGVFIVAEVGDTPKHLDLLIYQGSITRCSFSLFRLPEKYLVVQKKAFAAFVKTREDGVSFEQLLDGLERYKRTKPDKQSWRHPFSALMSQRDSPARISPF